MKTFLAICKEVLEEAGLSGTGPASIAAAVGIEKRIVGWVAQAWLDVQQYRNDWPWMMKDFSFVTSPDKSLYSLTELILSDMERWELDGASIYKTADGNVAERRIGSESYGNWWVKLRIGEQIPSAPVVVIVKPVDNAIILYPVPDAEYTVSLRYYKSLQTLSADADIPLVPPGTSWQDIIRWKALLYYAYHDGASDLAYEAKDKWDSAIQALDNRFGAAITLGVGPLA